uniref:Tumor necrosis factor receptor superfamily member 19L-like isoform X2 n=1 Tax=Petromyzon marinus TaxID=7757 RepID=A0AAJ7XFG3_PETMA|nr:tumor necrosis factor receptor superfamily member 19L-like isoform X2 [Petromyzon marinus]
MPPQVTNLSGGLSPEGPPPPGERVGHGRGMDLVAVAVVISFLALGLAGISLCKLLQRRGYRCKAEAKGHGGPAGPQDDAVDGMDSEEEMIRRIARLVTENPANHNALFALQQHQQRPDTFHVTRISEAGRRASGMLKGGALPLSPRGPGILGGASGTREGRGDA